MSEDKVVKEEAPLIWETRGHIAILTLNRPKAMNSFDMDLMAEHRRRLEQFEADDELRVLIYTGNGRAFSCGIDIKKAPNFLYLPPKTRMHHWVTPNSLKINKPTIAAINGFALGSGYELALACDIRIAAEEALIGSPEARVTSSVTGGAMRLVQDLVGPGKARELLFTAEYIDGKEAERIGLVNKAVPLDRLMDETMEMAEKISKNSSFSMKMIKKGFLMAQGEVSLDALMEYEIEACLACVSTKERQESLKDFEERERNK